MRDIYLDIPTWWVFFIVLVCMYMLGIVTGVVLMGGL